MNRPKYKELYLEGQEKVKKLEIIEVEYKELQRILAREGNQIAKYLERWSPLKPTIFHLSPLGFECLKTCLESNSRVAGKKVKGGYTAISMFNIPVFKDPKRLIKDDFE